MDFIIQDRAWAEKNCIATYDIENICIDWTFILRGKKQIIYEEEFSRVVLNAVHCRDDYGRKTGFVEWHDSNEEYNSIHECFIKRFISVEKDSQYYI